MPPLRITRAGLAGTLLVFVAAAVCVRLGVWQLDRLGQRRARNAHIVARMGEAPLTFSAAHTDTTGLAYRSASAAGHYDNARSIVQAGRSYMGTPGVYVFTPLLLPGERGAILVNRGWLPSPDAATVDLSPYDVTGAVRARGILLPVPHWRPRHARTKAFQQIWYRMNADSIAGQFPYPVARVYLQLLPTAGVRVWPKPVAPPQLDEGPHMSYAIQWFGFAAIAIIGWLTLLLRRGTTKEEGRGARHLEGDGAAA